MAAMTVGDLIRIARTAPRALRVCAAIVGVDLLLLIYALVGLESDVEDRAATVAQLHADLNSLQQKIALTRHEIDRLPELKKLYDAAIADGVIADQDRLKLVNSAQDLGSHHHLANMHYKLDAENVAPINKSKYSLITTPVSFEYDSVLDTDTLTFWQDLFGKLQAHYEIVSATLERQSTSTEAAISMIRAGQPVQLIHSQVQFRWLSLRKAAEAATK